MPTSDFFQKVEALKNGTTKVLLDNKKYILSKETLQDGKIIKVYGDEVGGKDFISFNLYKLESGWSLKPCEMPEQKVIEFILLMSI